MFGNLIKHMIIKTDAVLMRTGVTRSRFTVTLIVVSLVFG